jgi:curved DNA-binding protein CbpA
MESALEMGERDPRIPCLAAGWERRSRGLSPAEGFLLSRIDGHTPWTLLREIGGVPPEQADRCLERWLSQGVVEVRDDGPQSDAGAPRPEAPADAPKGVDESAIDESLDLSPELQREILEFQLRLDQPYHQLLGVDLDAETADVKRAYFALSKKYHPDRYFRQRIGGFQERLADIFKKLVEACELLSDPATRVEIQRQAAEEKRRAERPAVSASRPKPRQESRTHHLERLRRMLRVPDDVLAERRFKARQFFDASRVASAQGRWLEAASSVRLAIAFDPREAEYKRGFADIQARVYETRAAELMEKASSSLDAHTQQEALRLYEEVVHHRPRNAQANHRAAQLALELGEFEKAQEYAEAACEVAPEVCAHHVTLCRVLRRAGLPDRAGKALEKAEQLDRKDPDVQKEKTALRRARRRK